MTKKTTITALIVLITSVMHCYAESTDFYWGRKNLEWGDHSAAFEYFKVGAERNGYEDCKFALADMYLLGWGTPKNVEKAFYWFIECGKMTCVIDFYLGENFNMENRRNASSLGVTYGPTWKAPRYSSAFTNIPKAQQLLEKMTCRDFGIQPNKTKAIEYIKLFYSKYGHFGGSVGGYEDIVIDYIKKNKDYKLVDFFTKNEKVEKILQQGGFLIETKDSLSYRKLPQKATEQQLLDFINNTALSERWAQKAYNKVCDIQWDKIKDKNDCKLFEDFLSKERYSNMIARTRWIDNGRSLYLDNPYAAEATNRIQKITATTIAEVSEKVNESISRKMYDVAKTHVKTTAQKVGYVDALKALSADIDYAELQDKKADGSINEKDYGQFLINHKNSKYAETVSNDLTVYNDSITNEVALHATKSWSAQTPVADMDSTIRMATRDRYKNQILEAYQETALLKAANFNKDMEVEEMRSVTLMKHLTDNTRAKVESAYEKAMKKKLQVPFVRLGIQGEAAICDDYSINWGIGAGMIMGRCHHLINLYVGAGYHSVSNSNDNSNENESIIDMNNPVDPNTAYISYRKISIPAEVRINLVRSYTSSIYIGVGGIYNHILGGSINPIEGDAITLSDGLNPNHLTGRVSAGFGGEHLDFSLFVNYDLSSPYNKDATTDRLNQYTGAVPEQLKNKFSVGLKAIYFF